MSEYLLPSIALAILFFLGSWAALHSLIAGYKSGVISVRQTTYYKNDSRRFHGSDFFAIMTLYSIFGLFIVFFYSLLLIILSTSNIGLIAISTCSIINIVIALRRAPIKMAKPNTSFSIISILSAIITIVTALIFMTSKDIKTLIGISAVTCSSLLVVIHFVRLKTGKFYFKFKKKISKPGRSNANA